MRFSPLGGQLYCFVKDQRKKDQREEQARVSGNYCQTKTT